MITRYNNISINGMPVYSGDGAPSGTLGDELKGEVAAYFRRDASTADTVLYVTVDTGTTWAAYNNGAIAELSDGTVTVTAAAGSITETGLVNLTLTGSGTMELSGGGISQFGDDVAKLRMDGAGGMSLTGVTTLDLDASGVASLESSGGAINVGADNVAQAVNVATAGARAVLMGSAAAASVGIDAGTGALSLTADASSTWQVSGNAAGNLTLTLDAVNAGAGEGRLALNADEQIDLNDGTATLTLDGGALTETALGSADITPSGALTLRGGGVSTFGDDTGFLSFDGAGAQTTSGLVSASVTPSGAITLTAGADSTWQTSINGAGNVALTIDSNNAGAGQGNLVLTAKSTVQIGDAGNPAISLPGSGQVTVAANIDAQNGLDVTTAALTAAAALTVSGGNLTHTGADIDLDPTGTFDLAMDATKTATVNLADNLDAALLVQEGANSYFEVDTRDAQARIILGNATTNPTLEQLGSGQVSFAGNVNATGGLDVNADNVALSLGADADFQAVFTSGASLVQLDTKSEANDAATMAIQLTTGTASSDAATVASGAITVQTGVTDTIDALATAGTTGAVIVASGNAQDTGAGTGGASGNVTVRSGTSVDSTSGTVALSTGNVTAGVGNSGDITLTTGTSAGGTRGSVTVAATRLRLNDSVALGFGTPGTDLVMTPDGTDVVVTATGDLVIGDDVDLMVGTSKDLNVRYVSGSNRIDLTGLDITGGGAGSATAALVIETGDREKNDADAGIPTSGAVTLRSGTTLQSTAAATGGASGAVSITSGTSDVTFAGATGGASGNLTIRTGATDISAAVAATGGASGDASFGTGNAASTGAGATSGASGAVTLSTGTSADANTGQVTIESGAPAATGTSGNVVIRSGNPSGAGTSGDIDISTGATGGGTRGSVIVSGANRLRLNDSVPLGFGTPGTDLVLTPDGTDVIATATGDLVFNDSVDVFLGTGKDTGLVHNGTNTIIDHNTGELILQMGVRALTQDPEIGGELKRLCVDTGAVALDIADGTTALTFGIPSGARLVGCAANITTAISGVSVAGVTVNLAFTGGSTLSVGNFVTGGDGNVAQNTKLTALFDPNQAGIITSGATEGQLTISGGADNTPDAGAVRALVWYETLAALDNA